MSKKKTVPLNPTNLKQLDDVNQTESIYLARLQQLYTSIATGVDRMIVGGNYNQLIALSAAYIRQDLIVERLTMITLSNSASKSDKNEAENLLVAFGYSKLHGC